MKDTVVEIIRRVEGGVVWYEINCSRHCDLYNKVLRIDLYKLQNLADRTCPFTQDKELIAMFEFEWLGAYEVIQKLNLSKEYAAYKTRIAEGKEQNQ